MCFNMNFKEYCISSLYSWLKCAEYDLFSTYPLLPQSVLFLLQISHSLAMNLRESRQETSTMKKDRSIRKFRLTIMTKHSVSDKSGFYYIFIHSISSADVLINKNHWHVLSCSKHFSISQNTLGVHAPHMPIKEDNLKMNLLWLLPILLICYPLLAFSVTLNRHCWYSLWNPFVR